MYGDLLQRPHYLYMYIDPVQRYCIKSFCKTKLIAKKKRILLQKQRIRSKNPIYSKKVF